MSDKVPFKPLIWIICPSHLASKGYSIKDIPAIYADLPPDEQSQIMMLYRDKLQTEVETRRSLEWLRNHLPAPHQNLMTYGSPTWVNQLELAGLHLPDGSDIATVRKVLRKGALLGVSRHSDSYNGKEAYLGADYIFMSPVFNPVSKQATQTTLASQNLKQVCIEAKIPVVALGGITPRRVLELRGLKAGGIGFLGSVFQNKTPTERLSELVLSWKKSSD